MRITARWGMDSSKFLGNSSEVWRTPTSRSYTRISASILIIHNYLRYSSLYNASLSCSSVSSGRVVVTTKALNGFIPSSNLPGSDDLPIRNRAEVFGANPALVSLMPNRCTWDTGIKGQLIQQVSLCNTYILGLELITRRSLVRIQAPLVD